MTDRQRTGSQSTLSRRLLLLGVLPAVLMFAVLVFYFTSVRLDDARDNMARSSQVLADNLAPILEYAIVSGNDVALRQILDNALQHSDANWIRVLDVVDKEIGYAGKEERPSDFTASRFTVYEAEVFQEPLSFSEGDGSAWFRSGWESGTGILRVGTVQVGVKAEVLERQLREIWWSSMLVGGGMLLLTVVLVHLYLGNLLRPMHKLGHRVGKLIEGNYQVEPVSSKGSVKEIVNLQNQLNQLAEHLEHLRTTRDEMLAASESERSSAEHASRVKSEFLTTMSHELNTPLKGVIGLMSHIENEPLTPAQADKVNTAKKSVEDLLTVISDMLDYAHLDSGTLAVDSKPFDLRQLLSNCVASYRFAAEQQELSLELICLGDWPEAPVVIGDAPRVRQVLSGLLDNSLELTTNGFITVLATWVTVNAGHATLSCTVRDSSSSMGDAGNLHNPLTHSRYGGPGINLSLVQRLIELMGGHVHIELDLGQGNSFRFEIPFDLPVN
ncbi:sensor histidine kinase [Marinobacter litoralis]|uniref:sensor histidine kinase n=1 Tax=Marinobacter litoralis TaxID=187981 RepID=UPI0018EC48DF|nr:histidine kinase dimerization/phospho-acceptor domain-containing protein [Marinobacter litoralis]MBJ6138948.1 hybrid sensor histidine kinase/response regulator [Marinobacter litoralis]